MQVRWYGPCWGQSGYEELTRGLVIALDKIGVGVELQPANNWNTEWVELDEEDKDRLARMVNQKVNPDAIQVCHQRPREVYPAAKKRVCYSLFETNRCPDAWIEDLDRMDQVWVFSEFNRKYWAADWIRKQKNADKIQTIPFGIDTDVFSPDVKPAVITNKKGFTFLTVGDFTERKNFEGLIEAFVTEFNKDDDVCMIMKAHSEGFVRRHQDAVMEKFKEIVNRFNSKNPPRILFFGDKIAAADMPPFYRTGDCFVLASRGEGLGIPIIESMATGLPVIVTGWGAQTDYVTAQNGFLIESDVRMIDDSEYIRKCLIAMNHSWAYPSLADLKSKMRWMYENREEAKKMGEAGREEMKKRTWQKAGLAVLKKLQEMS